MKTVASRRAVIALIPLIVSAMKTSAASGPFLTEHVKGRAIVERAVAAAGGRAALDSLHQLEYRYDGSIAMSTQSFDAEAEARPQRISADLAFDFEKDRYYQLFDNDVPGMAMVASPLFVKGGAIYSLDNHQRQYTVSKGGPAGAFDAPSRYMPVLLVRRLLKNAASAGWVGEETIGGRRADVVEFSWDETSRYRLDVDQSDGGILGLRTLTPDPVVGDDEVTIEFSGEQRVDGLRFPKRAVSRRRGERYLDLSLRDVKVNQPPQAARFEVPQGFKDVPDVPLATTKLGEGLYEVSGLGGGIYRSQFVDMGDSVVVFEAPISIGTCQQVIGEIRKTLGEKPIRHVVISHFHNDHAAGVGAYVDLGATIVTTRGNEALLTRYSRARSALSGAAPRPSLQPEFLEVEGAALELKGRNGKRLVVYRVPDVAHVKDMLTLYDPSTKTILNGDLYASFFAFGPAYRGFAAWLQSRDAPHVTTIAGVHHAPISRSAFLELAARQEPKRSM